MEAKLRTLHCLGIAVFLLFWGPPAFAAQIRTLFQPTGELIMGGGLAHLDHECVTFIAHLTADDLFAKLTVSETPEGSEYWIGTQRVTKFPSRLQVNVYMISRQCPNKTHHELESQASLQDLQWSIAWKTGLKTRPLKQFEMKLSPTSRAEFEGHFGLVSPPDLLTSIQRHTEYWRVTLTMQDQDASISDSLVVTVMRAGKQIMRFSAHL